MRQAKGMSEQTKVKPRSEDKDSADSSSGTFAYPAWAGACLDELAQQGSGAAFTPDRKDELLALCPPDRREEGREFLETLPDVAKSLREWSARVHGNMDEGSSQGATAAHRESPRRRAARA